MRIQTARECFSISLLPKEAIEYLCKDIVNVYLPYAETQTPSLVGVL